MAISSLAMWVQQPDLATTNRLIMIFIGLLAVSMAAVAIAIIVIAVKALKIAKGLSTTVEELKAKAMPLLDVAAEIGRSSRDLLDDTAPKVKVIATNLQETSETLKATSRSAKSVVDHCDATMTDVNLRAQKQVARVDDMVTVALTTTTEMIGAITNGLKGPAHRVASLAGQAKDFAEGLFARFRARRAAAEEPAEPPFI